MLIDGLNITPTGQTRGLKTNAGTTFPENPSDGDSFRLTEAVNGNEPGMYWYNQQTQKWIGALSQQDVDERVQGLDVKMSVRAATTGNIELTGPQTVDGVALVDGDRVLVKNQTNATQNGIYIVRAEAWERAPDANSDEDVTTGMYTFVEDGTTQSSTGWNLATKNAITLGTTNLTFTQFGATVAYTAGNGINIAGGVISAADSLRTIDIAGSILGKPAASAVVGLFQANKPFTIPAGLAGSSARSTVAATAATVVALQKNGVQFGTLTWAAGAMTATLAAATATPFAAGDILTFVAPASQDATFANAAFTIAGQLA